MGDYSWNYSQYTAYKPRIHSIRCAEIFEWCSNSYNNDILGLSLEVGGLKSYFEAATFVSAIRLIISPLIALVMVTLIGLDSLEGTVSIVEAGVPSVMLSLVLVASYDLDVKVAASCIFLSTVLSMITLPILITSYNIV